MDDFDQLLDARDPLIRRKPIARPDKPKRKADRVRPADLSRRKQRQGVRAKLRKIVANSTLEQFE